MRVNLKSLAAELRRRSEKAEKEAEENRMIEEWADVKYYEGKSEAYCEVADLLDPPAAPTENAHE